MEHITSHKFWKFDFRSEDAYNHNHVPFIVPMDNSEVSNEKFIPDSITQTSNPQNIYASNFQKGKFKAVDIVNDFIWTRTPKKGRKDTPYIQLKEKRITGSSLLANAFITIDAIKNDGADALNLINKQVTSGVQLQMQEDAQSLSATLINDSVYNEADRIIGELKSVISGSMNEQYSGVLKSYNGYYLTKPTGFSYYFPLKQPKLDIQTTFSDPSSGRGEYNFRSAGGVIGAATKFGQEIFDSLNQSVHFNEPKTHFEKSKDYDPQQSGKRIDVEFYLDNTYDYQETIKNWHFIFMFLYQNTPGRRSISLLDPPCIYEVFSNGVMFAPYAFISNLNIDHIGLCRKMEIPFGQKLNNEDPNVTETITAIIPEVYKISMTIEALHTNVRNFSMESLNKNNITTRMV